MRHDDRPDVTKGFNLLWKGLEVTTGAQREQRYDRLMQQAIERGYALEPLRSYLEFFRYGCPPHGGAGIGLGRLLMITLGHYPAEWISPGDPKIIVLTTTCLRITGTIQTGFAAALKPIFSPIERFCCFKKTPAWRFRSMNRARRSGKCAMGAIPPARWSINLLRHTIRSGAGSSRTCVLFWMN